MLGRRGNVAGCAGAWRVCSEARQAAVSRLLLLSASPRRRQLFAEHGYRFDVFSVDVDETASPNEAPAALAERLARLKAGACPDPAAWGIGADTVVSIGDRIFGKPIDAADAVATLRLLRGREHTVTTGVAVSAPGGRVVSGSDRAFTLAAYGFRWFLLDPVGEDGSAARGSLPRRARASR